MTTRFIYRFGGQKAEGDVSMKPLLGGKGAGLAEMSNLGLPVPPGFTITTQACVHFFESDEQWPDSLWDQTIDGLKDVESHTGKAFGDPQNPLLVSVRSGAPVSIFMAISG